MIELISKSAGKPCEIVFERKNEKKSVTVTPQYDPATKRARIGIVFSAGVYEVQHPTPWAQVKDVCDENDRHLQRAWRTPNRPALARKI